tara:strand:+ start:2104 stop:3210 length:1107 start_codon:yes stop_codon:yes gene_type:complete
MVGKNGKKRQKAISNLGLMNSSVSNLGLMSSPLWKLPYNLGEDVIHKIHHEAVMKQINSIDRIFSVGMAFNLALGIHQMPCRLRKYQSGITGIELREVIIKENGYDLDWKYYPQEKSNYFQESNSIEENFPDWKDEYECSGFIQEEYDAKQRRIENIKSFGKRYKENRLRRRVLIQYPNADENQIILKRKLRLRIRRKWKEQFTKRYDFNYICSKKQAVRHIYANEVDFVRINQLERYKRLIKEIPFGDGNNKYKYRDEEMMYYLIQASFLKFPDRMRTELKTSKDYSQLGQLNPHYYLHFPEYINFMTNSLEGLGRLRANQLRNIQKQKFIDIIQNIYVINKYFNITRWDIYSKAFQKKYNKYIKFS